MIPPNRSFRILLIVVVLLFGYVFGTMEPVIAQRDWVTYTNKEQGFTIKHPRSFTVKELRDDWVYIGDNILFTAIDSVGTDRGEVVVIGENIGYMERSKMGAKGGNTPQEVVAYSIVKDGKKWEFILHSVDFDDLTTTDGTLKHKDIKLFREILSTLKRTN